MTGNDNRHTTCFAVCIHTADNADGVPADYLPYDAVVKIGTTELKAWEPHKLTLSKATKSKPRCDSTRSRNMQFSPLVRKPQHKDGVKQDESDGMYRNRLARRFRELHSSLEDSLPNDGKKKSPSKPEILAMAVDRIQSWSYEKRVLQEELNKLRQICAYTSVDAELSH
ncbi:hypothetical protein JX265_014020 [Neoarthrinium moseri]|uniref:BHLH domain-containing protein n=1 Tax=Neoarthrinium moseri TaxID=1658444 RepID=A0A9P9W7L4_9PEZI|nr:hypothetical protein JX266_013568 [Neoarthrinium moseri]KAI1846772.1 hypothetical protein JX265_014020 [Neoarthrinium moseri]